MGDGGRGARRLDGVGPRSRQRLGAAWAAFAWTAVLALAGGPAQAQVTISNTGDVSVGTASAPANLTVYGVVSGPGTVPIGGIIDWYVPSALAGSFNPPPNFVICDGSTISDPASPYNGYATPNLVGRFVQGVTKANIGTTGGAASQTVNVSVTLPATTGAIPSNLPPTSANQSAGLIVRNDAETGYRFILTTEDDNWNDGQHQHLLGGLAGGSGVVNTVPPYVGLLKIMRIK